MGDFIFNIKDYSKRVRLPGAVHPTSAGLGALQRAQHRNIPLENFDIQLGRGVSLDPFKLCDKLVRSPRGGYCFELNGLFLMALHAFGFRARPLLARVHLTGTPSGRGHQIALVKIDRQDWIVDVGFGKDTPEGPLILEHDLVQDAGGLMFRLTDGGRFGTMLQKREGGEWKNLYSFDMEYVCPADIAYGNHYTSTSPNSFFTMVRVAVKPCEDGYAALFNYRLKLVQAGREEVLTLPDGDEYFDALKKYFGIELDARYEDLKPVVEE